MTTIWNELNYFKSTSWDIIQPLTQWIRCIAGEIPTEYNFMKKILKICDKLVSDVMRALGPENFRHVIGLCFLT
jgi:hypothetical protein